MTKSAVAVARDHVTLAMDYGQFVLDGGLSDGEDEMDLLDRALSAGPCAGNGTTVLVLSPHQNNFDMGIDIERYEERPEDDSELWQQICESKLEIGPDAVLHISSPTMEVVDCAMPAGKYLIEVAGTGFVNYGWPGGTTPGDSWRLRLWPDDGTDPRPAVRWNMPGYGVPEDHPVTDPSPPEPPPVEEIPRTKWITTFHEDGTTSLNQVTLPTESERAERRRAEWGGGEPIEQVLSFNGGQMLTKFDRRLVETVLSADPTTARRVAVQAATAACEISGLAQLDWVRPALDALANRRTPPAPFSDISQIGDAFSAHHRQLFAVDDSGQEPSSESSVSISFTSEPPGTEANPFDMNADPGSMTIPALFSAQDPDPYRAAIETICHASFAFGSRAANFHAELRRDLLQQE